MESQPDFLLAGWRMTVTRYSKWHGWFWKADLFISQRKGTSIAGFSLLARS
jgi:hypothetical protein